jgi:hypothetical protein
MLLRFPLIKTVVKAKINSYIECLRLSNLNLFFIKTLSKTK